MGKKKKKDSGYQAAVSGAKGLLRLLVYVFIIVAIIFAGKTAYSFGYLVFDQHPMTESKEDGQDVTVIVKEEDSVYDVGKTLESKKLIESPAVFWTQEKLSDYKGKIKPGTYLLNTSQNVEEMLAILAGENTEGQPSQEAASDGESSKETGEGESSGEETGQ